MANRADISQENLGNAVYISSSISISISLIPLSDYMNKNMILLEVSNFN